jgi:hypothetical protein
MKCNEQQPPTTIDEQFIDEADLARMFGVSVRVLSNLAKKHRLLRRGRVQRVYYRRDAAEDFIVWYMGDAQQGRLSRQASASARAGWSTRRKRAA